MTTTHVFIVDVNTFKYHLEYQFAGTGAEDNYIDFNNEPTTKLYHNTEDNLVGMIADFQRVRKGDFAIFYLQQSRPKGVLDGKFFGIFKIKEDLSFLDNNDDNQFLKIELKKSLTFRTLLEPYEVYPKGVTEWEALDEIKYIQSPAQMLWSLIYRKLRALRGNTMITIYESNRLFKLIRDKNSHNKLNAKNFTFDLTAQEIISDSTNYSYTGRKERINILPRLINKYKNDKKFETHLQAYIVGNIGRKTNNSLDNCLIKDLELEWLGNEVGCGVGMQKIDIMISLVKPTDERIIMPIELKSIEADSSNVNQIQRYVDWIEQYYIPNRKSVIQPVLITRKIFDKSKDSYNNIINSFLMFNHNNPNCLPLKFIEFEIDNNSLVFNEVIY